MYQEPEIITSSTELEHSDDKGNDSAGDSKHWDSGVGSSSERTSTLSVSEGIRRFSQVYNHPDNHSLTKGRLLYIIHISNQVRFNIL